MSQNTVIHPSYLSRCTEDLAQSKPLALHSQATLLKVAAGVILVAFPVLLGGAIIVPSLFLHPIAGIAIGITLLFLNNRISSCIGSSIRKLWDLSNNARQEAKKCAEIRHHYAELSNRSVSQIQLDLSQRGIDWKTIPTMNQPEALTTLNPILAEAKYFDDKIEKYLKLRNTMAQESYELFKRMNPTPTEVNRRINLGIKVDPLSTEVYFDKRIKLTLKALRAEEKALDIKIQAAFANAVLSQGDYKGSIESIGSPTPSSLSKGCDYHSKMLEDINSDAGDHPLFLFKNNNIAPLTHKDVKRLSIPELAQRFKAAMV